MFFAWVIQISTQMQWYIMFINVCLQTFKLLLFRTEILIN